jgi:hypothetical protein
MMGPLRFELRSEDPQSPRMARLPYGPALVLFADIPYVSCCGKTGVFRGKNFHNLPRTSSYSGKVKVSSLAPDIA